MFIRLTRLDGSSIWLNAAYIVTVEPRRDGGSIVVPIGDGLDYDVKESAESVIKMLGELSTPSALPVQSEPAAEEKKPTRRKTTRKTAKSEPTEPPPEATPPEATTEAAVKTEETVEAPAVKPTRKPRTTRRTKKTEPPEPAQESEPAPAPASEPASEPEPAPMPETAFVTAPEPTLTPEQVERLRRMAPRSVTKLRNTLAAQFKITDAESAVRALAAQGVLMLDHDRVLWSREAVK